MTRDAPLNSVRIFDVGTSQDQCLRVLTLEPGSKMLLEWGGDATCIISIMLLDSIMDGQSFCTFRVPTGIEI